jgi:hypothetical protein
VHVTFRARRKHRLARPLRARCRRQDRPAFTLHRAKGCRTGAFIDAGQTFLEAGPDDVNLTRQRPVA